MAYIEASDFGVLADNSTDDADALQDAIDSAAALVGDANGACVIFPKGTVRAYADRVGSLFLRTNGGAGSALYVKESGTGSTGWAAK